MTVTRQITTRTLLRNFKEVKTNLISNKVTNYIIEIDTNTLVEIKMIKKEKGNVKKILNAAKKLPSNFKVTRFNLDENDIFPDRVWKK